MATATSLEDHGSFWIIRYDDGGYDQLPKDPSQLDAQAASLATSNPTLAAKFAMWANNIRSFGAPIQLGWSTAKVVATAAGILGGAAFLAWLLAKAEAAPKRRRR
jgi:hypothetical protein